MRTRMLPVLIALSVPALAAAQSRVVPARTRWAMQQSSASEADRLQLACAPSAVLIAPAIAMRVVGGDEHGKMLFGPDDPLVIGAGTNQGLRPGQEYFARRVLNDRFTPLTANSVLLSVHTAGWVRIVEADANSSIATVLQTCDGVSIGDYLEPYVEPAALAEPLPDGEPDYANPAQLVMADERRQSGYPGMLMLIDRGGNDGVRAGQRLTIFRRAAVGSYQMGQYAMSGHPTARGPILNVGEATVLNVRPQTSLVRIDSARDAVYIGDLVAFHK